MERLSRTLAEDLKTFSLCAEAPPLLLFLLFSITVLLFNVDADTSNCV